MYSGGPPPSFSSEGIHPFDKEQFQIGVTNDQPWLNQPPSQGSMGQGQGNSYPQFQDGSVRRGLAQNDMIIDGTEEKIPSFTGLGHAQGISHNYDGMSNNREYVSGQPHSFGAMVRVGISIPSDDGGGHYGGDTAPGLSDVARREHSQPGGASTDIADQLDVVGVSLVGKNFKKYYPDAYYKEKDEN